MITFQYRSKKKLNLKDLGFTSIIELISHLKKYFKVCSINDQFYIFDKELRQNLPDDNKFVFKVDKCKSKGV